MVKLEAWPTDKIPDGAISSLEEIEGRRPKQPLYQGEPILHRKLIDQDGIGGASEKIPKGYRVMSVKVTMDSAASGLILPGDRVDVLVYLGTGNGITSPTTKTILTDVTVFAVNEHINREVQGDGTTIQARTVSLLVKPEQVERLMLATELGKLQLSLRRADDDVPADSAGASLADLHVTEGGRQEINVPAGEPQEDSLLGLLESMQNPAAPEPSVPVGPLRRMEIYSASGVATYTWDDPTKLPRELANDTGFSGPTPGAQDAGGSDAGGGADGGDQPAQGDDQEQGSGEGGGDADGAVDPPAKR